MLGSFGVAVKCAILHEVVLCIIDIDTIGVVDCRVVLDDSSNLAAILLNEFASPVADCTESLDFVGLVSDSFGFK